MPLRLSLLLLALVLLAGCGQKGDLYLPQQTSLLSTDSRV
ncbi:MAG: lipoprotein [Marinospirillum sp.]|nr:lipoprotein [Marinospirillum sp.]